VVKSAHVATTHDDAFREIQLNGKQLVFLFMAVTVVSVVIFLTGVLVGRGIRAERGGPEMTEASALSSATIEGASAAPPPPSAAASNAPVTTGENLSYAGRLSGAAPANEQLEKAEPPSPVEEVAPADAPRASTPAPAPRAAAPAVAPPAAAVPAAAPVASGEPSGAGFAIQVAALRERAEAETIVKRLAAKGYPAYVLAPAKGTPAVFRVRVGKYKDRREADTVAARLQKEEQFKPWVVR